MRANVFRCSPNDGHRVGAGAFVTATFVMWQRLRDSLTSVNKNMVEAIDGKPRVNELLGSFQAPKRGAPSAGEPPWHAVALQPKA